MLTITNETPWTAAEFEAELRKQHHRYHHLHPFHQRMNAGELTKEEVQRWVINRFYYQRNIPLKDAAILSNCPDHEVRRHWIGRIIDHDGTTEGTGGIEAWLNVIPDYYDKYPKPCMGGWGQRTLIIAPNGDGLPCQAAMSIPHLTFANAREHCLEYIWYDSPAMNAYRGAAWMPELCQNCERKEIDWGGCRCQAYLLTQDSTATDPVCHLSPQHSQILAIREQVSSNQQLDLIYRGTK